MKINDDEVSSIFAVPSEVQSTKNTFDKRQESLKLIDQMKELEKKKEQLEKEISHDDNVKQMINYFQTPRKEFAFKIEYSDNMFREENTKRYIAALVKGLSNVGDTKITKWQVVDNFVYFETNRPLIIRWYQRTIPARDELKEFKMTQFRANSFFDDLS